MFKDIFTKLLIDVKITKTIKNMKSIEKKKILLRTNFKKFKMNYLLLNLIILKKELLKNIKCLKMQDC